MRLFIFWVWVTVMSFLVAKPHIASANNDEFNDMIVATEKIDFYSNYWINLHHYLFRLAKNSSRQTSYLSELPLFKNLNEHESKTLTEAIDYYQTHLIGKDLLFNQDMFNIKLALSQKQANQSLNSIVSDQDLVDQLSAASPIYQSYVWPRHDQQNRNTVNKYIDLIKSNEVAFLQKLEDLSGQSWPTNRIRIDMTYYANWAEAYTTIKPKIHAVISSLHYQDNHDFIELLWHESSHGIIAPQEFNMAKEIKYIADQLKVQVPNQLWHGILFYLAGATTKEILRDEGIKYELIMVRKNIFSSQIPYLVKYMQPYVDGQISLHDAIKGILMAYQTDTKDG